MIVARGLGKGGNGNIVSSGLGLRVVEIIAPPDRHHRDGFSTMHAHDADVSMNVEQETITLVGPGGKLDTEAFVITAVGWEAHATPNTISYEDFWPSNN